MMCKLYPMCTPVMGDPSPASVSVIKAATHVCQVTVKSGAVDPEIASQCISQHGVMPCDVNKVYHEKMEFRGQMEFRTADNVSRIVYDASRGCAGWQLETNRETSSKVAAVTFKNAEIGVVNAY